MLGTESAAESTLIFHDKNDSKYSDICLNINFSYTLEIFDKILTGL